MRLFASVALLSLALTTSVSAQVPAEQSAAAPAEAAAPATAAPAADKKKDGMVCRKEIPTGSHFPVKVCTTAEQRKSQRTMAQQAQESMQAPNQVVPN